MSWDPNNPDDMPTEKSDSSGSSDCSHATLRAVLMKLANEIAERQDHWENMVNWSDLPAEVRQQAVGTAVGLFEAASKVRREIRQIDLAEQSTW